MNDLSANKKLKDKKYSINTEEYLEENGISEKNNIVCPFMVNIKAKICLQNFTLLIREINLDIEDDLKSPFEFLLLLSEVFSLNRPNS